MRLTRKAAINLGITAGCAENGHARQPGHKHASDPGKLFDALARAHGLPVPVHEYAFCPGRRWRFDYLFEGFVAVERVGGVWKRGHHSGGRSQIDDMERRNAAQILGYVVLEFTPEQLDGGAAFPVIRAALAAEMEMP